MVRKLGGFRFSNEVCKNTSHVVAGSPRRTLNVLMGIAQGCWIVCYEWVSYMGASNFLKASRESAEASFLYTSIASVSIEGPFLNSLLIPDSTDS